MLVSIFIFFKCVLFPHVSILLFGTLNVLYINNDMLEEMKRQSTAELFFISSCQCNISC